MWASSREVCACTDSKFCAHAGCGNFTRHPRCAQVLLAVWGISGALALLGGAPDGLREGARVRVGPAHQAILQGCDGAFETPLVRLDNGIPPTHVAPGAASSIHVPRSVDRRHLALLDDDAALPINGLSLESDTGDTPDGVAPHRRRRIALPRATLRECICAMRPLLKPQRLPVGSRRTLPGPDIGDAYYMVGAPWRTAALVMLRSQALLAVRAVALSDPDLVAEVCLVAHNPLVTMQWFVPLRSCRPRARCPGLRRSAPTPSRTSPHVLRLPRAFSLTTTSPPRPYPPAQHRHRHPHPRHPRCRPACPLCPKHRRPQPLRRPPHQPCPSCIPTPAPPNRRLARLLPREPLPLCRGSPLP